MIQESHATKIPRSNLNFLAKPELPHNHRRDFKISHINRAGDYESVLNQESKTDEFIAYLALLLLTLR